MLTVAALRDRLAGGRVRRAPTVLQMDRVECGAAALAMVLAYHGRSVPLDELRVACDVNRDGANQANVLRAARSYGLRAKGLSGTVASLDNLPLPAIINWRFSHFVVLEGRRGDRFYINDPAAGRRRVRRREFEEAFTGLALAFEVGPEFVPGGAPPSIWRSLLSYLKSSRPAFGFVLLASAGLIVPGLVLPLFTTIFIDEYLVRGRDELVPPLLLLMALMMVLSTGFGWLRSLGLLRLRLKLALSRTSAFLWHMLRLPLTFFQQRLTGELTYRVAIGDSIAGVISSGLAANLLNFFTAAFFLALMFVFDATLALLAMTVAALNLLGLRLTERVRLDAERLLIGVAGTLYGVTQSGLAMIDTLKASGREDEFYNVWVGNFARKMNVQRTQVLVADIVGLIPGLLAGLGDAAILCAGATRILDGGMTIGMLVAFQLLRSQFIAPFNQLVGLRAQLQRTESELARLDDVLGWPRATGTDDEPVAVTAGADPAPSLRLRGDIALDRVSFGYSRHGPPLLADFSLEVAAGERVALVGGTGSGKTTIVRLLAGLYAPADGEIRFDRRPRPTIPRAVLANSVALVDQEIHLFHDTVRANLSLWDSSISTEQLVRAARDACIHDVIAAREGGYDARVSERGTNLSGGQRQRLEIARALAGNPSVLLLDEATSALDPVTEKLVMDNLRRRGATCLLVAHRLSTIRDCDTIVVLEQGRVVDRGPHQELVRSDGPYRRLIEASYNR